MNKILLLDTSVGTSNMGDHIIMECVREELQFLLKDAFVFDLPTHLPAFNSFSVWRNSLAVQNYATADWKLAGGSNLLVKDLKTHYPQWNIHPFDSKPLRGTILVGVGAGAGEETNAYTTRLYRKVLNGERYHSVRDERSKAYVENVLGLKAINTGCVTMWKLTPEFCKQIPTKKASRVVFTLTGKDRAEQIDPEDQALIDILKKQYGEVFFWVQGDRDLAYFEKAGNTDGIHIMPPSLSAYDSLLNEDDLDYVGTRLHGGVYAMRHKKRAVIIAIDERAKAIHQGNHLNCISKNRVSDELETMLCGEIETKVEMPLDEIKRWKSQFFISETPNE